MTVRKEDEIKTIFFLRPEEKAKEEVDKMSPLWERRERRRGGGGYGGGRGFGGRRPRQRNDEPKPVKEGDIHTVTISEVSRRGDGIARIKNFVVFVPGAQKGDTVKIKIKEVRGNHATAEIVSGEEPSEAAETPETPEESIDEVVEKEGVVQNGDEEPEKTEAAQEEKVEFA